MTRRIFDPFSDLSGKILGPPGFLCIYIYGLSRWASVMLFLFPLYCCGGVSIVIIFLLEEEYLPSLRSIFWRGKNELI